MPDRKRHEGSDRLPGHRIRPSDHRRLRNRQVRDERRLDLGGRDVVAADQHDVVHPAQQPVVPVLVALGTVAGEVAAGES